MGRRPRSLAPSRTLATGGHPRIGRTRRLHRRLRLALGITRQLPLDPTVADAACPPRPPHRQPRLLLAPTTARRTTPRTPPPKQLPLSHRTTGRKTPSVFTAGRSSPEHPPLVSRLTWVGEHPRHPLRIRSGYRERRRRLQIVVDEELGKCCADRLLSRLLHEQPLPGGVDLKENVLPVGTEPHVDGPVLEAQRAAVGPEPLLELRRELDRRYLRVSGTCYSMKFAAAASKIRESNGRIIYSTTWDAWRAAGGQRIWPAPGRLAPRRVHQVTPRCPDGSEAPDARPRRSA